MNYSTMKRLEKEWTGYINASKRAWENGNTKLENMYARKLETAINAYGITCDWPGLGPCFQYQGHEYYNVEGVINAISEAPHG